jgi:hypothetical protein
MYYIRLRNAIAKSGEPALFPNLNIPKKWRDGRDLKHPQSNSLIYLQKIDLSTSASCKKPRLRSTNVLGCAPTLAAFGRKCRLEHPAFKANGTKPNTPDLKHYSLTGYR